MGVETQRHGTRRASERTTPCLCALFSLVALMARVLHGPSLPTRRSAWYATGEATVADALPPCAATSGPAA